MMVIVFIGWGWTITFIDINEFDDLFLPIFIFLGMAQLIISMILSLYYFIFRLILGFIRYYTLIKWWIWNFSICYKIYFIIVFLFWN